MSEEIVTVSFTAKAEHKEHWLVLLEGLIREEQGAYLEERIEPFGKQAEDELESLLDDCKGIYVDFVNLQYEANNEETRFSITIQGGGTLPHSIPRIVKVLDACGVMDVRDTRL